MVVDIKKYVTWEVKYWIIQYDDYAKFGEHLLM